MCLGCRVHAGKAPGRRPRLLAGRESIFEFSHNESRKKFQNLDLEPDSTRQPLQSTRWVCEGGREAAHGGPPAGHPLFAGPRGLGLQRFPPWESPWEPAWGGMSGCGWAPLQAQE